MRDTMTVIDIYKKTKGKNEWKRVHTACQIQEAQKETWFLLKNNYEVKIVERQIPVVSFA